MSLVQHSYVGKGSFYIRLAGTADPLSKIGNVSKATLSVDEEEKKLADYENAGGGNLDTLSRVSGVNLEVETSNMSPDNLALAFRAAISSAAGASVVDEVVPAALGGLCVFARIPDADVAVTVKDDAGTTTYVENTDYTRSRAGIVPLATGSIGDGDDLKVSYTALADSVVQGLVYSAQEYEVVFEGLNEAKSGNPSVLSIYRWKISPSSSDLIGDDFGKLTLKGEVTKDSTKTGTGISQYFKTRVAQLA